MEDMPAERFFSYAERLTSYKGVLRARAEKGSSQTTSQIERTPNSSSKASGEKTHFRDVKHNPELAQYFD